MSVEVRISESEFQQANALLQTIDQRLRVKAVQESLAAAADIVVAEAKAQVPQPGYKGDKAGKKPLRDTIAKEVRSYHSSGTFVGVVGAQYPAGAHAHLVEHGHEIWLPSPPGKKGAATKNTGKRTTPDPWLERASDNTQARQVQAIMSTLKRHADTMQNGR